MARLQPIINLVDNMVKLGTLYRGLNTQSRPTTARLKVEVGIAYFNYVAVNRPASAQYITEGKSGRGMPHTAQIYRAIW